MADMRWIPATECSLVVRKQILVVESSYFMKQDAINNMRKSIADQMKDGLVILPNGFTAKTCDADMIMIKQEDIHD